jgi:adenylate kinase
MNIILVAPPAAGKGTQSKLISSEYNIPHISTGDLLRDEVNSGSPMGHFLKEKMDHGELISDDIIVNLLRNRITQVDCNNGYILDGYPRNIEQALIYENLVHELGKSVGYVIFMDIDKDLALKRTIGRIVCSRCGTSYNKEVSELNPRIDGICDKCGNQLSIRSDDNVNTAKSRFDTYLTQTKPLIEYYKRKGILKELVVEENETTEDIFNKIKSIIG